MFSVGLRYVFKRAKDAPRESIPCSRSLVFGAIMAQSFRRSTFISGLGVMLLGGTAGTFSYGLRRLVSAGCGISIEAKREKTPGKGAASNEKQGWDARLNAPIAQLGYVIVGSRVPDDE